jgi:4,5-dihydroxyphthalate decarboxylase
VTQAPVSLRLGLSSIPITRSLFDGSVRPAGIELHVQSRFGDGLDNTGARHREIIAGNLDGGELSLSSFVCARLRGVRLWALPVFPARRFRHRSMYCAVNSPLRGPEELAGKKATAHRYNATTPVWLKGILQNEYGVKLESIEWRVAEPDIGEESMRPPPASIRIHPIPPPRTREHAIELVEQSRIDAALEPYQSLAANPKLRPLISNYREAEAGYFRRTGAIPVVHTIVLREEIVEAHPWLPERLLDAFRRAQDAGDSYRSENERAEANWEREIMGEPFQYSLQRGCARRSVELLMEYQTQQGLIDRPPKLAELFFPEVMDL